MNKFHKLKKLTDFEELSSPIPLAPTEFNEFSPPTNQYILRMLVKPKYGDFIIPHELTWLAGALTAFYNFEKNIIGINDSWCYITVRSGEVKSTTDDEWHFDGASFRVETIPERNYIYSSCYPTEYKLGKISMDGFDPLRHNIFKWATKQVESSPTLQTDPNYWYMIDPFCLHRKPPTPKGVCRTFVRISFTDIEIRDKNNTQNPKLSTNAYGRDPVKTFREKLS